MLNAVLGAISSDLAIDLGTENTRLCMAGRGVVCCEPSWVAIQSSRDGTRRVLAVGEEARRMSGRTPPDIRVLRPVQDGVVSDFELAEAILRIWMTEVQGRRLWVGPRVAMASPHGTTDVERRALRESAEASGAREVVMVEQPIAAGHGLGLPVDAARGHLIIDVGAGSTEVSVISLGGVVHHRSVRVGGRHLDQAVVHHVDEVHGVRISMGMAEVLKIQLGSAMSPHSGRAMEAKGRHVSTGFPRAVNLSSEEVCNALLEPLQLIVSAVISCLEHTPPDLASDVAETGMVMTGGGALLHGLPEAVGRATGLPVVVPDDPITTVVKGALGLVGDPRVSARSGGLNAA